MKDLDFSIRWTMMKAEAHYEFVKNSQGDEYDYIDLKGINDILTPLRLKYFISDKFAIIRQENKNGPDVDKPAIYMIDLITGEEKDCISLPWPGFDQAYGRLTKAQMIGANLTYIRRYLLMCAYDISVAKDMFDSGCANQANIPTFYDQNDGAAQQTAPVNQNQTAYQSNDGFTISEDPNENTWDRNALEDARNTIIEYGPYAGMRLGDVERNDFSAVVNMAKDARTDIGAKCRLIMEMTR